MHDALRFRADGRQRDRKKLERYLGNGAVELVLTFLEAHNGLQDLVN